MNVLRYSAAKEQGVPIDRLKQASHPLVTASLLSSIYSIEGEEVPMGLIDITPSYFDDPEFRYFVSRNGEDSPVVVDLMPRHHNASAYILTSNRNDLITVETPLRTIEIPTDQPAAGILAPSPQAAGQILLHELLVYVP
jgi:hypothetical protein